MSKANKHDVIKFINLSAYHAVVAAYNHNKKSLGLPDLGSETPIIKELDVEEALDLLVDAGLTLSTLMEQAQEDEKLIDGALKKFNKMSEADKDALIEETLRSVAGHCCIFPEP
jgi:hypothetical protein